jgi:large subunit ribosomal protein L7/L12
MMNIVPFKVVAKSACYRQQYVSQRVCWNLLQYNFRHRSDCSKWATTSHTLSSGSNSWQDVQRLFRVQFSDSPLQLSQMIQANKGSLFLATRPRQLFYRTFHSTEHTGSEAVAIVAPITTNSNNEMPPILWTTHRLNKEQIAKIDAIFHKILWLDMFESAMLNEMVNKRMDLTLTPKQKKQLSQLMENRAAEGTGNLSTNNANADQPEEEAGPVLVDIKLASFDKAAKIKVIKEVRSILGLGLKEAKEMVESAPVVLQKGLKQEAADEMKAKLEASGATVELL